MGCSCSSSTTLDHAVKKVNDSTNQRSFAQKPFDYAKFRLIDDHARKAPATVKTSIQLLASYLASSANDNFDIVRAFYVWISENISYDAEAYFSDVISAKTDAEDVLRYGKTVCEGFSNLFLALCEAENITCKKLSGYAKGYGHSPGSVISYNTKTNHAWNAVQLQGSWYLIDATWGRGFMGNDRKSVKRFTNFYFLTSPENFIHDHFPYMENITEKSKHWQLLKQPVSIEEFSKRVKLSSEARVLGVHFPNHAYEVIKVKNSSELVLDSSNNPLKQIMYDFYNENGESNGQCVMIEQDTRSQFTIKIHPKATGRYFLDVYGSKNSEGSCPHLVKYVVDCESPYRNFEPFPKYKQYYGLKPDFEERGFVFKKLKPFHTSNDGEYTLEMKTLSFTNVLVSLYDSNDCKENGFSMIESRDNNVKVRVRLRKKGYYKLVMFSKVGDDPSYSEACTLLIQNMKASQLIAPFPQTYSTTTEYNCQLLMPLTRNIAANSEVKIQFSSPKLVNLLVKASGKYKIINEDSANVWKVIVNTKQSGTVTIYGKVEGASSSFALYEFIIN